MAGTHCPRDIIMFDHLGIVVKDLRRSARLYAQMLAPLGLKLVEKHRTGQGEGWVVIADGSPSSPFFVIAAGRPSFWPSDAIPGASPVHLCFTAPSPQSVDDFHRLGVAHGAKDNGAPGIRRPPFYCAFVIDPDGNNVEAGCYLP
jgi:catechol 2,3-dioxygenase-like lactoylglutathione lyase family enzyme